MCQRVPEELAKHVRASLMPAVSHAKTRLTAAEAPLGFGTGIPLTIFAAQKLSYRRLWFSGES